MENTNYIIDDYINTAVDTTDTTENTLDTTTEVVTLDTIHNDLGFICVFLVMATIYILCKLIYKGFNIFF